MWCIRSFVFVVFLQVWQYVKCQDQDVSTYFGLNPNSNSYGSITQPILRLPLEANRRSLFDELNLDRLGIGGLFDDNGDVNYNGNTNVNMNRNSSPQFAWHKSRSRSRSKVRNRRPNFHSKTDRNQNMNDILRLVNPLGQTKIDLNLPYARSSIQFTRGNPLNQLSQGRRSGLNVRGVEDGKNDDKNEGKKQSEPCSYHLLTNILQQMRVIKHDIEDLENEVISSIGVSQETLS